MSRNESDIIVRQLLASPSRKKNVDFPWPIGSTRAVYFLHVDDGTFYRDVLAGGNARPAMIVAAFVVVVAVAGGIMLSREQQGAGNKKRWGVMSYNQLPTV